MTLSVGTTLGPYQIVGPLGTGGMGEVYRARDTKLNRDVALKVLPELFASDPERLARFQRCRWDGGSHHRRDELGRDPEETVSPITTINAEHAEHAEKTPLCGFCELCVECRIRAFR